MFLINLMIFKILIRFLKIDKRGDVQLSDFCLSKLSDKTFFPISIKVNSTNYSILNNKDEITNYELSKSSIPLENKKPK